jgi:hypothetical protein
MDLLQKYRTWRHNRRDPKRVFPGQKHVIVPAFELAGVEYYRFDDVFNLPYERGLTALVFYEETRMRCSREYLEKHVEVVRNTLRSNRIDIFKLNQLNEQMGERLKLSLDVDLLYKLASIVFFDRNENPVLYDAEYCRKKVDFWKKHKGVSDFFFAEAADRIDTLFKECRFRFGYLFPDEHGIKPDTFGKSVFLALQKTADGFKRFESILSKEGVNYSETTAIYDFLFQLNEALKPKKQQKNGKGSN